MDPRYRNYFKEIFLSENETETIDERLEVDPEVRALTEKILVAKGRMSEVLDREGVSLWLTLEEMLNTREAALEALYFNAGFEHGYMTGEAFALRMVGRSKTAYRAFADEIRQLVVTSGLPSGLGIAALAETAWVLALDMAGSEGA